jgi:hypothetical protein
MTRDARLILEPPTRAERWEDQERADYNLDNFRREFRERLYSSEGRECLESHSEDSSNNSRKIE